VTDLNWLPEVTDWRHRLHQLPAETNERWHEAVRLANARMNFVLTNALDQSLRQFLTSPPPDLSTQPVRLAVLGSSTIDHLLPSIRVGGLRRNIWVDTYTCEYGQYNQELRDASSTLHMFQPTAILIALDSHLITAGLSAAMDDKSADRALQNALFRIRETWAYARGAFHCPVVQQTFLPVHMNILGNNEYRLPGSRANFVARINAALREAANTDGIDILPLDDLATRHGVGALHDPALWHRSKQEVSLKAAPLYGDLVGRWLAALQGRTAKCLVLDLDNTLWGGVIGDDGMEGIELGQGSPLGEAYIAIQEYARELSRRGVILAVCSKNEMATALEPFERHPDMILRTHDIACFVANWHDKASNLRAIADELNIGLDSLVFVDDNRFERDLVRRIMPMVSVPELPDDPADYTSTLSQAGYFENLRITKEDRQRSGQYRDNRIRTELAAAAGDISSYLQSLEMRLIVSPFDDVGLPRIVQLVNKSNQFNLTSRRYSPDGIREIVTSPDVFGLQFRLLDRIGDNGVISIIICRLSGCEDVAIDVWLMSCRVLGREVEHCVLNAIVEEVRRHGRSRIIGEYIPTSRNVIVKDHYKRLGFTKIGEEPDGWTKWCLDATSFEAIQTTISVDRNSVNV